MKIIQSTMIKNKKVEESKKSKIGKNTDWKEALSQLAEMG
jgi:hypothetical protein